MYNTYVVLGSTQKGIYWWHLVKCILQLLNKPEVVFIHSKSHSFSYKVSWNQTIGDWSFFHFLDYQIDCFWGFGEFHSFHVTLPMYNKHCLSILELFWMRQTWRWEKFCRMYIAIVWHWKLLSISLKFVIILNTE